MSYVNWEIRGSEISTCNCDWGCPCQFNALPTKGDCRAAVGLQIDEGHFGDIKLDGMKAVAVFAWPGAIHQGKGEGIAVIDESATPQQREALLKILGGQETEPFATIFSVVAAMVEKFHEPIYRHIEFTADQEARTGRFAVANLVEANIEPIRNPVTGAEHRAKVVLPQGFEYTEAEFASGNWTSVGPIVNDLKSRHAHLCQLHLGPHGVIH